MRSKPCTSSRHCWRKSDNKSGCTRSRFRCLQERINSGLKHKPNPSNEHRTPGDAAGGVLRGGRYLLVAPPLSRLLLVTFLADQEKSHDRGCNFENSLAPSAKCKCYLTDRSGGRPLKFETHRERLIYNVSFCQRITETGLQMFMELSVTVQSMARTCTPARAASRRAAPKAGSVASLGCRCFTSAI